RDVSQHRGVCSVRPRARASALVGEDRSRFPNDRCRLTCWSRCWVAPVVETHSLQKEVVPRHTEWLNNHNQLIDHSTHLNDFADTVGKAVVDHATAQRRLALCWPQ